MPGMDRTRSFPARFPSRWRQGLPAGARVVSFAVRTTHRLRGWGSGIRHVPEIRVVLEPAERARRELAARYPGLRPALAAARREVARRDREAAAAAVRAWRARVAAALAEVAGSLGPAPSTRAFQQAPAVRGLLAPLLLAGSLFLGAGPARAAGITPQGVIAAAADNPGQYGTHWRTTIWAEQHLADDATLTLCAATNDSPAEECQTYDLPRGVVVTIPNAWSGFSAAPPGGLVWRVDGTDRVALFSRTYTTAPVGAAGTLGQGVPAQRLEELPIVGTSQYVPLAMRDGFRSNVGFFNATGVPSVVKVRIHTGGGNIIAERDFSLPGYGWHQITDIFSTFGVEPHTGRYAEVIQMTGEKLAVYGSLVDNTSGDPTFFPAKRTYDGQQQLFIPVAAHLPGYNNTTWVTDVWYLNASRTSPSLGGLDFYPYNNDNHTGGAIGQSWFLGSGEMKTIKDVVYWLGALGLPGNENGTKGTLWQAPLDSHLLFSRTFNDRGAEGTFGQSLPAIIAARERLAPGLEGVLVGLSESADPSSGYRSGIGLLNTGTEPATFHIRLYDDQGTLEGTIEQDVPPMSLVQIDKVYRRVTSDDIHDGKALVTLTQGQGFAYASIIDNQNGDATTQYATIIDRSNNQPPTIDEVCEDTYYQTCSVDADGNGQFDRIWGIPYEGLGGSGEPAYFRLVTNDPDGDEITDVWVEQLPDLRPGSIWAEERDGTWYVAVYQANTSTEPTTVNVSIQAYDSLGKPSRIYMIPFSLYPEGH